MLVRHMLFTALLLGAFALGGTGLVALTFEGTAERIAANEREFLLRTLNSMVPRTMYDNDLHSDVVMVTAPELLGSRKPAAVYRARRGGADVAVIITAVAPGGYSGDIKILVAIDHEGMLLGARVINHRETPGLGDGIDVEKSPWIHQFPGHSLSNPDELGWRVEKDGGIFDQFTGATITPRAVVKAVHDSLLYYSEHKAELFGSPAAAGGEAHGTH